jgi:hypothetical protein
MMLPCPIAILSGSPEPPDGRGFSLPAHFALPSLGIPKKYKPKPFGNRFSLFMKKCLLALIVAFASPLFALAQEPAIRPDIEELFTVMRLEKTMQNAMDQSMKMVQKMTGGMAAQALSKLPPEAAAKATAMQQKMQEKTMALVQEEMSWKKLKGAMGQVYTESLTPEEVKGVTAFYKSPAGQAFLDKQPVIMQKSMAVTQKMMMEMMPKLQALIQAETAEMMKEAAPAKPAQ